MEEEGKDNELHYKAEEGDEEVNEMRNKEEKEKGDNFAFYIQNKKMKKTVKKTERKKEYKRKVPISSIGVVFIRKCRAISSFVEKEQQN